MEVIWGHMGTHLRLSNVEVKGVYVLPFVASPAAKDRIAPNLGYLEGLGA